MNLFKKIFRKRYEYKDITCQWGLMDATIQNELKDGWLNVDIIIFDDNQINILFKRKLLF